ncbi:hybrid-cluster NAD(P)-dependent oxidoreductase [Rhizobium sp. NXC24]|uniref:hybrid-cluster NAD(P)-dependent oxidoreductase n=1 Tax=Rhizobium sp. NXC24 TaxID=2048897 RepID=UPI000CDF313B|nr:hybrid-cluster NAD(P)-dependent oxidoreductase [Rhizobium sp. NXC24]AVA21337.1 FAD/NAD-binding ferredoxin reductase-type protein [Rhizobium sp. NXC24]
MNSIAKISREGASLFPACPPATNEIWTGAASKLRVVTVADEAPNVKTFVFQPEHPALFKYTAGQFLTLELSVPGGLLLRTYTIASSPSRPMTLSLTVKAQVDSVGTRWMFENLLPGSLVKAIGPAGNFTLERCQRPKLLFLSAGSGITPMMSMLRWLSDVATDADVAFVHCARSPEEIIFREELASASRILPGLVLGLVVGRGASDWEGLTGRLDIAKLESLVPDYLEREIFCCGPEAFMENAEAMVAQRGFAMAHFHQEAFTFASHGNVTLPTKKREPEFPKPEGSADSSHRLCFRSSGVEDVVRADETVLNVAHRNGVSIPSVCGMGLCGTCRVKKISGHVEMEHNGGITEDEIEDGYILACCSKPLSNIEIEE